MARFINTGTSIPSSAEKPVQKSANFGGSDQMITSASPLGGFKAMHPGSMEKQGGPEGPSGKGPLSDTGRMKTTSFK